MVRIRAATLADRPAVLEIARAGMAEFGVQADFEGFDAALGRIGAGLPPVLAEFVAQSDEGPSAAICGSIILFQTQPGTAKLTGFYVHDAVRGRGVGRALYAAVILAARTARVQIIELETLDSMHAAVGFYESQGWQRAADPAPESGVNRAYFLIL